jgi:hypothetical protein
MIGEQFGLLRDRHELAEQRKAQNERLSHRPRTHKLFLKKNMNQYSFKPMIHKI